MLSAGKLEIPPPDIRRISTGYPPDFRRISAGYPENSGYLPDIRRISGIFRISDFPALLPDPGAVLWMVFIVIPVAFWISLFVISPELFTRHMTAAHLRSASENSIGASSSYRASIFACKVGNESYGVYTITPGPKILIERRHLAPG